MDLVILHAILSRHGEQLRKPHVNLWEDLADFDNSRLRRDIPMEFSKELILRIQRQCLLIEDIAVTVKRNKSSASEAELYKYFSRMTELRRLFLTLDCLKLRVFRDTSY